MNEADIFNWLAFSANLGVGLYFVFILTVSLGALNIFVAGYLLKEILIDNERKGV